MALTKDFKETIRARAARDHLFKEALFKESIENLLAGDLETGKALLRNYINATIGFESLARLTAKSPKSLMRMFSPSGNPRADNIFGLIHTLQQRTGVTLQIQAY